MSRPGRYAGKTVLITGGCGGMGQAHVRGFASEGANVIIADLDELRGPELAGTVGSAAHFVTLNVTDEESWDAAIARAKERFGPVDVLVNNAATLSFGSVEETEISEFRRVLDVNLTGAFIGMRKILPLMRARDSGSVVNIVSAGGMVAYQSSIAYVAAKWGLRGMTRSAAMDMAGTRVRVNAIFPGPTRTPMISDFSPEYADALVSSQVMPRWGEPDEVTAALLFLCGDEASFCTGAELSVDGGAALGQVTPKPQTIS